MIRLLASAALLAAAGPALSLEADKLYEQASRSVFVVVASNLDKGTTSAGSGVVVAPGKVITNCHVVAGATRIRVERDNASYGASVEFADTRRNLCQLEVKDLTAPPAILGASTELRIGQRVYAIGAPRGVELVLSEGMISSLRAGDDADTARIQTSAALASGSSGGGLFDSDGKLVAITTWRIARGDAQGSAYGLPAEWIKSLGARGKADPASPQVGDSWTYAVLDLRYKPNDRSKKHVHTVRKTAVGAVTEEVVANGESLGEFTFTSETVGVVRGGVLELAPFVTVFRPLQPGDVLGAIPVQGIKTDRRFAPTWKISRAQAVRAEKLVVPAGSFDTIRVEVNGYFYSSPATGGTMGTIAGYKKFSGTAWYAPSVKRIVRQVISGDTFTDGFELESYALR
jgi:serine protease Do